MSQPRRNAGPLWAVTSYFNPMRYRRRRMNFRIFRERLTLPLVAVELSFDGRFELSSGDAEVLIQRHGRDVMWQKERLLNIALGVLPSSCEQVLCIDCDVIFQRQDWAREVSLRLEDVSLLQPFSRVQHLPPDAVVEDLPAVPALFEQTGTTAVVAQGHSPESCIGKAFNRGPSTRASGFAWAARRELLEEHGLYDACVIGGGDTAMIAAAYGVFEQVIRFHQMNDRQQSRYMTWAGRFHRSVRGKVDCIEGDLLHLWHGSLPNRQTAMRHQNLASLGFDPFRDISLDDSGCWRWNTDKPALHAYLKNYFRARQEDAVTSAQGGAHAASHTGSPKVNRPAA